MATKVAALFPCSAARNPFTWPCTKLTIATRIGGSAAAGLGTAKRKKLPIATDSERTKRNVGRDELLCVALLCLVLLIGLFLLPAAIGAAWLNHSRCGGWLRGAMSIGAACISLIARPAAGAPVAGPGREVFRWRFRPGLRA